MAEKRKGFYMLYFVICATLSLVSSLTLPYMVTHKPLRNPTNTYTTIVVNGTKINVAATTATKGVNLFKVSSSNGATCILLKVDGLIEVYFKSYGEKYQAGTYMLAGAAIEGNCNEDSASMTIKWDGYTMIWNFAKTPGGERWYVNQVELIVSTELDRFHTIKAQVLPEKSFKLVHAGMLFQTPVGKSYACDEESIVDLSFPKEVHNPANLTGMIFLRTFQLQPFVYKGSSFGPAFDCESEKN